MGKDERGKVPAGATHQCEDRYAVSTGGVQYYKFERGYWFYWPEMTEPRGVWKKCEKPCKPVTEVQPTWNGEGLPPVDVAVEAYFHTDTNPDWLPFTLKYFSEEHVVFQGPIGECHMSRRAFDKYGFKYRPIRTPKQIAAEERETVVAQMLSEINYAPFEASHYLVMAERLCDAGYRKVVPND